MHTCVCFLRGLEGAKTGQDAWDNPMNILKAASDTEAPKLHTIQT